MSYFPKATSRVARAWVTAAEMQETILQLLQSVIGRYGFRDHGARIIKHTIYASLNHGTRWEDEDPEGEKEWERERLRKQITADIEHALAPVAEHVDRLNVYYAEKGSWAIRVVVK